MPVGFVVVIAVQTGWGALAPLIFRPRVGELLVNTVLLVVIGVPCAVVLGVGGAWLVERTTVPLRPLWAVLLAAPLAIPAFVSSYGWASAIPGISGLGGGLLVAVLAYYPLVFLPALASIRGLDPALEESARALGLSSAAVFVRVVLPQLKLAIWGGGLVVALHLLSEYGAFAQIRFETFTTAIIVQFQSTFAGPAANALGIVLAVLSVILLVGEAGTRGSARYARLGSGSPSPAVPVRLGRRAPLVVAALAALAVAAVVVPLAIVIRWLLSSPAWQPAELLGALGQTAVFGLLGALAATAVALPIGWLSARHAGRPARAIEAAAYVSSSLPVIIVALALVTVTIRVVPAFYQSVPTVVVAYVIVFLPRALVSVRAGIAQAPLALEEAARSLGVRPSVARWRVTLRLALPSIAAGAALVALGCANELTATLLLAPNGTRTLATQFWSASSAIQYADAAPYALLLIVLSAPAVAIMFRQVTTVRR